MSADLSAQPAPTPARPGATWDAGGCATCCRRSATRIADQGFVRRAADRAPTLRVGGTSVRGRMGDTRGEHWHFYATDLLPGRRYQLALVWQQRASRCASRGSSRLFRRPTSGRRNSGCCSTPAPAVTRRLNFCRRRSATACCAAALSFPPDAAVANGDHVYWDLLAPVGAAPARIAGGREAVRHVRSLGDRAWRRQRNRAQAHRQGRRSCRCTARISARRRCSSCRTTTTISTTTKPLTRSSRSRRRFMLAARPRDTASLLPRIPSRRGAAARPAVVVGGRPRAAACPKASARCATAGLAEILLYDVRRTLTLAGPSAVYVDLKWRNGSRRAPRRPR